MADDTPANDRPALEDHEIEVTPEMIEAGVAAWCRWDSRFEEADGLVVDVFEAMCRERPARWHRPE